MTSRASVVMDSTLKRVDRETRQRAVDLVIDYGVFSSSGERRHFSGGASVGTGRLIAVMAAAKKRRPVVTIVG